MSAQAEPGADPVIEIEQALLGAALVNNKVLHKVGGALAGGHFLVAVHGRIFDHIKRLVERDAHVTPTLLAPYFDADDSLAEVGGTQYLNRLAAAAATIGSAPDYAAAIHEAYLRRRLLDIAFDINDAATAVDLESNAQTLIEDAERALWSLAKRGGGAQPMVGAEASFDETLNQIDAAIARGGEIPGVTTGIRELDNATGGLIDGRLHIIAGRPGMGKSALAIGIAEAAALYRPVLYFSGEMPHVEIMERIMAAHTGIPYEDIMRGHVDGQQRDQIASQRAAIAALDLSVQPLANLTAGDIAARARRFKRQHDNAIVFVDHIGHIRPENPRAMRVHQIEEITGTLKALALDTRMPVVALSQLNRAVEVRDEKKPSLSDLRDSGSIEQDGDLIIFVYREAYYFAQRRPNDALAVMDFEADLREMEKTMELLIRKNRSGRSPRDLEVACDLATNRIGGRAVPQEEME